MTSDVSDVSADVFLQLFGEHFFIFCKQAGYDTMLRTLGGNLIEFIGNLDALHSFLALSYQVSFVIIPACILTVNNSSCLKEKQTLANTFSNFQLHSVKSLSGTPY